ncbi:hypothetical protein [Acinetobacter wuhouensis]|uniref:Uncharacterized protein n=1 Tax=Acinetobacter wuhouensis TaxID=1879050 RepID=A0A4Q7AL96_9GAMM|nr:hypothetical protein [Acinetobacter wuhouensis]RZG47995.1 hypothetical protein EXU28_04300 [Acinetobacter wuhouensis]RZG75521.1 hypothetical protein EXU29_01290 [Acinetobacter wuhouensis]
MKKYMLSAFLILSSPQIVFAEQNIVVNQSNQQISIINEWLAYQDFESKMQQINEEFRKKFENSLIHDFEAQSHQIEIEDQKQNKILKNLLNNLHPQTQELKEIKGLWLEVLETNSKNIDEEQQSDNDAIGTKIEKIDTLNSGLDVKVFHLIQQQNPPEYVSDWIRYTQLKSDMEQKRDTLNQTFNDLSAQTKEEDQNKLKQEFIQKITQSTLNILNSFKTNSSELKDIVAMQIQATKAAKKMNLKAVSGTGIADDMNENSEILDQIKALEQSFEAKIVQYVRSTI